MSFTQELPGKLRLPWVSGRDRLKYLGIKGETAEKIKLHRNRSLIVACLAFHGPPESPEILHCAQDSLELSLCRKTCIKKQFFLSTNLNIHC